MANQSAYCTIIFKKKKKRKKSTLANFFRLFSVLRTALKREIIKEPEGVEKNSIFEPSQILKQCKQK